MPHPSSNTAGVQHADVVVIGGANVDRKSRTFATPVPGTSNPGRSRIAAGGVGRNVAENLGWLGVRTALVTVVGDDADGRWLLGETEAAGVDVSHALACSDATGAYDAILDDRGDLVIAVASMEAIDALTVDAIEHCRDLIANARVLVLDGNVEDAALALAGKIARENAVDVVADPVSVAKAAGLKKILAGGGRLHTVTPNRAELFAICGGDAAAGVSATDGLHGTVQQLLHTVAANVWVRLGAEGSVFGSMRGDAAHCEQLPPLAASLVDVTGAGDAMLAAYVAGLLDGLEPLAAAAEYGRAAAAITVESEHTVSRKLDRTSLLARTARDSAATAEHVADNFHE